MASAGDGRFRVLLARHLKAKMAVEGLSYEDVSKALGLAGKNYVFRAASEQESGEQYAINVSDNLHKLLDFLDLEPRDFSGAADEVARWGDLSDTILRLDGITQAARYQLHDVVTAFLKSAVRY